MPDENTPQNTPKSKDHKGKKPADQAAAPAADQAMGQPNDQVQLEALQQQVGELTEALQRERADATNIRRRHEEQIAGLRNIVKAGVVRDLLPVVDNFERALKHVPADLEGNDYIKGVQGVVKQFEKTLSDMGVVKIATVGEPFDPHFHEFYSNRVAIWQYT
jgi:molecular chaperone GrpE